MRSCARSLRRRDWIRKVWQYFTIVPDFKSVGVKNNARCFEYPVIIRAVNTIDAMTASIEQIDWPVLAKITDRILKEVKHVNRVCYDLVAEAHVRRLSGNKLKHRKNPVFMRVCGVRRSLLITI